MSPRNPKAHLLLDPDLLGFGSAAFFGTIAMGLSFWRQADGFVVAMRTGLTAVVAYAATFLFVRYLRSIADRFERERRKRLEEERLARAAAEAAARAAEAEQEGEQT